MGELKQENPDLSSTEEITPKRRGNPNLSKGKANPYYKTGNTQEPKNMADEAEVVSETKTNTSSSSSDVAGDKKVIPDDIFSDVMPEKEVLPLDGEVKIKEYANLTDPANTTIKTDSAGGGGSNKPPIMPGTEGLGATATPLADPTNQTSPTTTPIEGVKTPEQIKTEAQQFVKLLIGGYDQLHGFGRWASKKDLKELAKDHDKGKINLNHSLVLGEGTITLREFIHQYNTQIEEDLVVTEDFKKDITPPLERIAIKRGWGLGDEGLVIGLILQDAAPKIASLWGLIHACNSILDHCTGVEKSKKEAVEKKEKKSETKVEDNKDFVADADTWREADNIEDAKEVK